MGVLSSDLTSLDESSRLILEKTPKVQLQRMLQSLNKAG